ncbi:MAG: GDSL-type esterase/lipase family protein [bacterium]
MMLPLLMALSQDPLALPRTDANSVKAHQRLVVKAKTGRIDLYFLGDSITRRWGTADPMYGHFLANWKSNFFGWNAGNFGWGGDSTANILWRIENGELDGVNPKVIVFLGGTNDVSGGANPEGIIRRINRIKEVCQVKAPQATLILMAIFPRNDNLAHLSIIAEANRGIAKLADGKKIRFLNVNDMLADQANTLRPGMMDADKLHMALPGYQVWADGLKPILRELLGKPATVDLAPPPTLNPELEK